MSAKKRRIIGLSAAALFVGADTFLFDCLPWQPVAFWVFLLCLALNLGANFVIAGLIGAWITRDTLHPCWRFLFWRKLWRWEAWRLGDVVWRPYTRQFRDVKASEVGYRQLVRTGYRRHTFARVRRWRGRWRLWWNLCPACNSDNPEIFDCGVCGGYHEGSGDPWPPGPAIKKLWWKNFTEA